MSAAIPFSVPPAIPQTVRLVANKLRECQVTITRCGQYLQAEFLSPGGKSLLGKQTWLPISHCALRLGREENSVDPDMPHEQRIVLAMYGLAIPLTPAEAHQIDAALGRHGLKVRHIQAKEQPKPPAEQAAASTATTVVAVRPAALAGQAQSPSPSQDRPSE